MGRSYTAVYLSIIIIIVVTAVGLFHYRQKVSLAVLNGDVNYKHVQLQTTVEEKSDDEQTTVEDLLKRLVIVTAVSDNHFVESEGMLASVRKCLPRNQIILYDLGLNERNKKILKALNEDIDVRSFSSSDYHVNHLKNLMNYAWKPVIVREVTKEHDVIMYGDASMRMISCDLKKALSHLFQFPLFAAVALRFKAIEFVHDGMMEYLHYPKQRRDIANMYSIEATGWLLWANPIMKEKFIEPWYDGALHRDCIAPNGSELNPCHYTWNHNGRYIGCHRYDQAAMDLIFTREFGRVVPIRAQNRQLCRSIWRFRKT